MFSCVCVLLIQCAALCWTMPLQMIRQRSEEREKMIGQSFQYFCIRVFLIKSCFTLFYSLLEDATSKTSDLRGVERERERVRLSSFVSSTFRVNVKERRSQHFDDN